MWNRTARLSRLFIITFSLSLFFSLELSHAQDDSAELVPMVVVGSRIPAPAEQLGSALTVMDGGQIEDRGVALISDLLRDVPGLAISRTGTVGNFTVARIRGAESNHTLVLIDGIEANDPVAGFEFDFGHLLAAGIERIEVLRGPQSALYGSDAIGGVINIVTKRGKGPFAANLRAETGSFSTSQLGLSASGETAEGDYGFSVNHFSSDGINVARMGDEEDGYENLTFQGKGGINISERFRLDASLRLTDADTEFDNQDFAFPATPTQGLVVDTDTKTEVQQLYARVTGRLALTSQWQQHFSAAFTETDNDNFDGGVFTNSTSGERRKFEYQSSYFFRPSSAITVAFEREELTFENRGASPDAPRNQAQKETQDSAIAEYRGSVGKHFYYSLGLRHDNNERFDDAMTYRATGAYLIPDIGTRIHASLASGVTNPGFFELFGFFPGSFVGNPDLEPEKSRGFDIGIEQSFWADKVELDLTYFSADLEDEIITTFDPATFLSSVDNLDQDSDRQGIELSVAGHITDWFWLSGSYSYIDASEPEGTAELRRPEHIASLNAAFRFLDGRARLNIAMNHYGEQEDAEFIFATPETRVMLDPYTLVTISGSYDFSEKIRFHGRLENVTDEDYEEVFSYRAPGFGAFGGLTVAFGG